MTVACHHAPKEVGYLEACTYQVKHSENTTLG